MGSPGCAGLGSLGGAIASAIGEFEKNYRDGHGPVVCFHGVTENQSAIDYRDELGDCRFAVLQGKELRAHVRRKFRLVRRRYSRLPGAFAAKDRGLVSWAFFRL